jgi:hypothetical protein
MVVSMLLNIKHLTSNKIIAVENKVNQKLNSLWKI